MKAAWFESFGAPKDTLIIGEQPTPLAGPGEVMVRIKTTGVNPSDVKKRAGSFPNLLDAGLVIPHSDGAGIIEAVGEGVDRSRIGERVWIYQAQFSRRFGSAAEYVAIDASRVVPLPEPVSFEVGACLGIPVMTAHRAVFADGDVNGKTVLVTGGAGRVGYYAIQWASMAGAIVIATASNDADKAACLEVGAHHVVNHRDKNWHQAVLDANGGEPVERVIDVEFGTNLPEVLQSIGTNGVIATYSSTVVKEPVLPFFQMMYKDLTVRCIIVYAMPEKAKAAAIEDITDALVHGKLQHRVAEILPFDQIARSHEVVEEATVRGCVVVSVD